jgi:hypothetical protein
MLSNDELSGRIAIIEQLLTPLLSAMLAHSDDYQSAIGALSESLHKTAESSPSEGAKSAAHETTDRIMSTVECAIDALRSRG